MPVDGRIPENILTLVATVTATIVAYLVITALTVLPYAVWRRRAAAG